MTWQMLDQQGPGKGEMGRRGWHEDIPSRGMHGSGHQELRVVYSCCLSDLLCSYQGTMHYFGQWIAIRIWSEQVSGAGQGPPFAIKISIFLSRALEYA